MVTDFLLSIGSPPLSFFLLFFRGCYHDDDVMMQPPFPPFTFSLVVSFTTLLKNVLLCSFIKRTENAISMIPGAEWGAVRMYVKG